MTVPSVVLFTLATEVSFALDVGADPARDRTPWWRDPPVGTLHAEPLRSEPPPEPPPARPSIDVPIPMPVAERWIAPVWTDGSPPHNEVLRGGTDGIATSGIGGVERVALTTASLDVEIGPDGGVEHVDVRHFDGDASLLDGLIEAAHAQLSSREAAGERSIEGASVRERWQGSVYVVRASPSLLGCFVDPVDGVRCGEMRAIELRRAD